MTRADRRLVFRCAAMFFGSIAVLVLVAWIGSYLRPVHDAERNTQCLAKPWDEARDCIIAYRREHPRK